MTRHSLVRLVVLGCGTLGNTSGRFDKVLTLLPANCACLGLTKSGLPKHPLYLKQATSVVPYLVRRISLESESND